MGDHGHDDGLLEHLNFENLEQIDWDNLFIGLPEDSHSLLLATDSTENFSTSSPDSVSFWIGQVENMLMKDDDSSVDADPSDQFSTEFLADILVPEASLAVSPYKDSTHSSDNSLETEKGEDKIVDDVPKEDHNSEDPDDPHSKKRRRQLRNRDAAVRSRERKKMYVRDLETKSRYLEGECRRLGRLLQCCIADNQALRLALQKGNAFGATSAKQESAVLLLESLLLGSLLWFLGIMCLFNLPAMPQSTLVAVPLRSVEKAEKKAPERGAGSKMYKCLVVLSFASGRRCKASRTRMKAGFMFIEISV